MFWWILFDYGTIVTMQMYTAVLGAAAAGWCTACLPEAGQCGSDEKVPACENTDLQS